MIEERIGREVERANVERDVEMVVVVDPPGADHVSIRRQRCIAHRRPALSMPALSAPVLAAPPPTGAGTTRAPLYSRPLWHSRNGAPCLPQAP